MTTDITELAQSLKAAAVRAQAATEEYASRRISSTAFRLEIEEFESLANKPANILALVEKLELKEEQRTVTVHQSDYFASLVAMARISADKAMRKFPQPNYVLLKVAEEAGEVVQAGVHYAESRMEWKQVEGEIVQLLAMLIRLVTEGDEVNGVKPPASCAAGIKWEGE